MLNIDLKANVCSVKYNPVASHYLAVGSADHHVHSYDMRRPGAAVCVFSGHSKAVSYVQFLSVWIPASLPCDPLATSATERGESGAKRAYLSLGSRNQDHHQHQKE